MFLVCRTHIPHKTYCVRGSHETPARPGRPRAVRRPTCLCGNDQDQPPLLLRHGGRHDEGDPPGVQEVLQGEVRQGRGRLGLLRRLGDAEEPDPRRGAGAGRRPLLRTLPGPVEGEGADLLRLAEEPEQGRGDQVRHRLRHAKREPERTRDVRGPRAARHEGPPRQPRHVGGAQWAIFAIYGAGANFRNLSSVRRTGA